MESVGIRRTRCAAAVALRPTTFRRVASVATLPSERESIIGVLKLKDKIPLGLIEWGTKKLYTADLGMDSMKEQHLNPRGQLFQHPVRLKNFNE